MVQQLCRAQDRLGRHAASVQAVAAHLVLLDQGDLGFHRRRDVGADQPGRAATDHDQVGIKGLGLVVALVDLPRLDPAQQLFGDDREQAQQHEGAEQPGRGDITQRLHLRQLGAGIHIDHGAGKHADLADPVESPGLDRRQAHDQVDQEEWEGRH